MRVVIAGGGLAAASAAAELRARGHDGEITLFSAERYLPYERPPLSKSVLLGKAEPESAVVHARDWYADNGVDLRPAERVLSIDLDRRLVHTGGAAQPYDRLLVATGAQPRRLPMVDASGVRATYLRTIEDAVGIRAALAGPYAVERLLVIGGGWIGLEVASAARTLGVDVTLVEALELPLLPVLGEEVAAVFARLHRDNGVDLRLATTVRTIAPAGGGDARVELSDGTVVDAGLVVVGIGARPDDALARDAGLAVDDGILVDATLRTSDPHVLAAGDVASHDHPLLGRIRVEHWDASIHQGRHAAAVMLGEDEPYTRLPYFFTDQFDLGMEYVGHVGRGAADEVVLRGDVEGLEFQAFWMVDGVVRAAMHVNDWDAIDGLREQVGRPLDTA